MWFCRQCKPQVLGCVEKVKKLEADIQVLSGKILEFENKMGQNREDIVRETTIKVMENLKEEEDKKTRSQGETI